MSGAMRAFVILLAALILPSCGGSPSPDTAPVAASATATVDPATSTPVPAPPPGRPGGMPPAGTPGRPGGPGPEPNRPGGMPPGVEHDIPTPGGNDDDYPRDERSWLSAIDEACDDVEQPARCLTLDYRFFAEDPDGDNERPIPQPGRDEIENVYVGCRVNEVDPPSDPPTIVPAGTVIRVEILCTEEEPTVTETTTPPSEPLEQDGSEGGPGS